MVISMDHGNNQSWTIFYGSLRGLGASLPQCASFKKFECHALMLSFATENFMGKH